MIYVIGSLFWIIPQLSHFIISILPVAFKAILQLYRYSDEYNSTDEEELSDNEGAAMNYNVEYQNMIEKNKASETDDEEDIHGLDEHAVLYDSPLLSIPLNKLIKDITLNLSENYPEVMDSILRLLTETDAELLNSITNSKD